MNDLPAIQEKSRRLYYCCYNQQNQKEQPTFILASQKTNKKGKETGSALLHRPNKTKRKDETTVSGWTPTGESSTSGIRQPPQFGSLLGSV
jgi:hypothetical protein